MLDNFYVFQPEDFPVGYEDLMYNIIYNSAFVDNEPEWPSTFFDLYRCFIYHPPSEPNTPFTRESFDEKLSGFLHRLRGVCTHHYSESTLPKEKDEINKSDLYKVLLYLEGVTLSENFLDKSYYQMLMKKYYFIDVSTTLRNISLSYVFISDEYI